MNTTKECPKCGSKNPRVEVSIKTTYGSAILSSSGEAVLQNKPASVVSFQCRECGTWFS